MMKDAIDNAEERMKKAMDALRRDLSTIRTGRASPALLDRVHVEYYGAETPLNQLAGVSAPEARTLRHPAVGPRHDPVDREGDPKSDLGMTPNNDGQVIRLSIPPLTEERRKQLVKTVHAMVEDSKVAVRNVRRTPSRRPQVDDHKQISEDEERRGAAQIDDLAKHFRPGLRNR